MTNAEFTQWESDTFGYGYGTGEAIILPVLQTFLAACRNKDGGGSNYSYERISDEIGAIPTWLLINILARTGIIEYGTSPRYGWLTSKGEELREFVCFHSVMELCDLIFNSQLS